MPDHLRAQLLVVSAWMIAADIGAVVLLAAPSMRQLHRAVDDLRLLGGVLEIEAHGAAADGPAGRLILASSTIH